MKSQNLVIKIFDIKQIPKFKNIIFNVGEWNFISDEHLYITSTGINPEELIFNIIGFKLESDSDETLNDMINKLIKQ